MAINNSKDTLFSTQDTALAAWLYSQGFELVSVEAQKFPSTFSFNNSSPQLAEAVRLFQCGKAEGNIFVFFKAYKTLLRMIKEEKENGGRI